MGIVVGFAAALALFGVAALYAWWVTWCTDNIEKIIPSLYGLVLRYISMRSLLSAQSVMRRWTWRWMHRSRSSVILRPPLSLAVQADGEESKNQSRVPPLLSPAWYRRQSGFLRKRNEPNEG